MMTQVLSCEITRTVTVSQMLLIVLTTILDKLEWDPELRQMRYTFHFNQKKRKK